MVRVERSGRPLCLIAIDLDYFKCINDTHGHHVGDLVLQAFSKTAMAQLRAGDVLCRIGGEEFAALLPDTSEEQAQGVAERLRLAVEAATVDVGGPESLRYTASLGVTRVHLNDASLKHALRRADEALYRAKNGGRNRVRHAFW